MLPLLLLLREFPLLPPRLLPELPEELRDELPDLEDDALRLPVDEPEPLLLVELPPRELDEVVLRLVEPLLLRPFDLSEDPDVDFPVELLLPVVLLLRPDEEVRELVLLAEVFLPVDAERPPLPELVSSLDEDRELRVPPDFAEADLEREEPDEVLFVADFLEVLEDFDVAMF